jgi:hypothetical protein
MGNPPLLCGYIVPDSASNRPTESTCREGIVTHMKDDLGEWLETGRHGAGMTRAEVAQMWPELVEDLD